MKRTAHTKSSERNDPRKPAVFLIFAVLLLPYYTALAGSNYKPMAGEFTRRGHGARVSQKIRDALSNGSGRPVLKILVGLRKEKTPAATTRSGAVASFKRRSRKNLERLNKAAGPGKFSSKKELWLVNGFLADADAEAIRFLSSSDDVEFIVENFSVSVPQPAPGELGGVSAAGGSWGLEKIRALDVWESFGVSGNGIRIGHLDTGVDAGHPDLKGRIAGWAEFDWNGNRVSGSLPHDSATHGTLTAGILVGGDSSGEPIGVAPGAKLLSALVLNGGVGSIAQVIAGMQWIVDPDGNPNTDDGARILSMSLGVQGQYWFFEMLTQNLMELGVLTVGSIGNGGPGRTVSPGNAVHCLGAGASTAGDDVAYFSGGGELKWDGQAFIKPDLVAPGVDIRSSLPMPQGYGYLTGTSAAAPHVAGAAALLLEINASLSPLQLGAFMRASAVDIASAGQDSRSGYGRMDVFLAASAVMGNSVVHGVVRDTGGPVGAVVRATGNGGSSPVETRSNSGTGEYTISLLPGYYEIEVWGYSGQRGWKTVHLSRGEVVSVDFMMAGSPGDINAVRVYPNPYMPSRGHTAVTFDILPDRAKIKIYTLSGTLVRVIKEHPPGWLSWDVTNSNNQPLASGLYFYTVASDIGMAKGKLAVIR